MSSEDTVLITSWDVITLSAICENDVVNALSGIMASQERESGTPLPENTFSAIRDIIEELHGFAIENAPLPVFDRPVTAEIPTQLLYKVLAIGDIFESIIKGIEQTHIPRTAYEKELEVTTAGTKLGIENEALLRLMVYFHGVDWQIRDQGKFKKALDTIRSAAENIQEFYIEFKDRPAHITEIHSLQFLILDDLFSLPVSAYARAGNTDYSEELKALRKPIEWDPETGKITKEGKQHLGQVVQRAGQIIKELSSSERIRGDKGNMRYLEYAEELTSKLDKIARDLGISSSSRTQSRQ